MTFDTPLFEALKIRHGLDDTGLFLLIKRGQEAYNRRSKELGRTPCAGLRMLRVGSAAEKRDGWICNNSLCPSCWIRKWAMHFRALESMDTNLFQHYWIRGSHPTFVGEPLPIEWINKVKGHSSSPFKTICTGVRFMNTGAGLGWMFCGLYGTRAPVTTYSTYHLDPNGPIPPQWSLLYSRDTAHMLEVKPENYFRLPEYCVGWFECPEEELVERASQLPIRLVGADRMFQVGKLLHKP